MSVLSAAVAAAIAAEFSGAGIANIALARKLALLFYRTLRYGWNSWSED